MADVTDASGQHAVVPLDRLETGIPGLDLIAGGGLARGRNTLVAGVAGAGKTVFALQFLAEGIRRYGQPGVFVTLGESVDDHRVNAASLGFDIAGWEQRGLWRFVDASQTTDEDLVIGDFDFSGLTTRILAAANAIGAVRVSVDSLSGAFHRFPEGASIRLALQGMLAALKTASVTAVVTIEGSDDELTKMHLRIGEHVTDAIVRLEYRSTGEQRRRTVEVVKVRGGTHRSGAYPFTMRPVDGIVAIPLGGVELTQSVTEDRVTTGDPVLDEMCGGGCFRDSVLLVAGATGTGKTLLASTFLTGGIVDGERTLFIGFEESAGQVQRNARNWGHDVSDAVARGQHVVICRYPESAAIEEHLVDIIKTIETHRPHRIAVDSLTALERVATEQTFREFMMALTGLVKEHSISGLYTVATELYGGTRATGAQASVLADCIIVLRYVESRSDVKRVIGVLKMRGSAHDRRLREYRIDHDGLHIGEPLEGVGGIFGGRLHGDAGP